MWLECLVWKALKIPLSLESAETESLQKLFANIRGQIGVRVRRCDVRNRLAYACVYWGGQKGVDVAHIRPAEHNCHARDLSALIDVASRDYEEVGICGKQRVKVGHHMVLPNEAMGPVESGVKGASHHLAPAVDAGGKGGKISRQSTEDCECAVLPKSGCEGCAVRAADLANNLALVVNGVADIGTCMSSVRKRVGSAVFPHYGVLRCEAVSRVAHGLAWIVDPKCGPVWISIDRWKRLGLAVFP